MSAHGESAKQPKRRVSKSAAMSKGKKKALASDDEREPTVNNSAKNSTPHDFDMDSTTSSLNADHTGEAAGNTDVAAVAAREGQVVTPSVAITQPQVATQPQRATERAAATQPQVSQADLKEESVLEDFLDCGVFEPQRSAWRTINGFALQICCTVLAWMSLSAGEFIVAEHLEDIDVVKNQSSSDGIRYHLIQVKYQDQESLLGEAVRTSQSHSNDSPIKVQTDNNDESNTNDSEWFTISNADARKYMLQALKYANNPHLGKHFRLYFSTTKKALDKRNDPKTFTLNDWNQLRGGQSSTITDEDTLALLQKFVKLCMPTSDGNEKPITVSDVAVLLNRVIWIPNDAAYENLKSRCVDKIRALLNSDDGARHIADTEYHAKIVFCALFASALETSGNPNPADRRLDRESFANIFRAYIGRQTLRADHKFKVIQFTEHYRSAISRDAPSSTKGVKANDVLNIYDVQQMANCAEFLQKKSCHTQEMIVDIYTCMQNDAAFTLSPYQVTAMQGQLQKFKDWKAEQERGSAST